MYNPSDPSRSRFWLFLQIAGCLPRILRGHELDVKRIPARTGNGRYNVSNVVAWGDRVSEQRINKHNEKTKPTGKDTSKRRNEKTAKNGNLSFGAVLCLHFPQLLS